MNDIRNRIGISSVQFPVLRVASYGPPIGNWPTWVGATLLVIGSALVCYGEDRLRSEGDPEIVEIVPLGERTGPESFGAAEENPDTKQNPHQQRFREGMLIRDRQARFAVTSERSELIPSDGTASITVLENLNMQRVRSEMVKLGAGVRWDVTAEVTEFEGHNFVLIKRAVIASEWSVIE